jgi:hypothetical protein
MQEEPHGFGSLPNIPFLPTVEEIAQIEREQTFHRALESLRLMKEFWLSHDATKRAVAMRYLCDVQEWLNVLYFDSEFLSFGSDAPQTRSAASPERDWNAEAQRMADDFFSRCD